MTSRLATSLRATAVHFNGVRVIGLLAAALTLSACSGQDAGNAATPPAPAAPTATAPAATTPAPATTAPAATAPAETATAPAATPGPVVPPTGAAPVAGTDYVEVTGGAPFDPAAGKIEVAEVFGYTCPHCATFEPVLASWKAKAPADVKVTPIAAPFGGYWVPYAKAFYTAQSMGLLDKTHDAMFRAIHIERSLPPPPTVATNEQIAAFYAKHGANPQEFTSTMASFATDAKLKRATQWIQRMGVESTPTLVINGKYRVIGTSHEETLRIAEHLIARERGGAAAAPATGG
ncbi:MAG: Periplasmic thiol:disulfide interchange protein DsbA [uncultured Lysobacter sp.]|uniref:Periplasmic thiol:disulfide interchange protein DsbA n=1 Tax=uncultured Lysobacter sp. TaxID=271060 RepID=A0A6J4LEK4_9GAMM|nr:MAG: Periplasmic thiol:disulfide interchange protein DsbA [uncultured Lysobacter sp.]